MWSDAPPSAAGLGLGYGIAIAIGSLVLVSTVLLASYLCIRAKASRRRPPPSTLPASPSAAAAEAVGLDGTAVEAFYPKFVCEGIPPADPCPICLAEYEDGEALRRAPECGHCFHAACIDEWLRVNATCPLCRSSPVASAAETPVGTPLSELIPLAARRR